MAAEVVDDVEMREAQRDYLDFLDDDVSLLFHTIVSQCKDGRGCSCRAWSLLTLV